MDTKLLLPALRKLVTDLSEDLLQRSIAQSDVDAGLRAAYTQIEKGGRTSDAFEVWREDYLDQVAVAWVLGCVFVRFMEDNQLIDECWLAGEGDRRKLAEDTHELYFREHPHDSDREYFEHVFHAVGKIPAAKDLFAEGKTPLWAVGPSGDMAMRLLAFWREVVPETGKLKRSFAAGKDEGGRMRKDEGGRMKDELNTFPPSSLSLHPSDPTRFLGDLYQDLSERARKKYALLQTPVFVEEFILDRTLDPAIAEFGLDEVRMIDPTCGSGHFLLGGFARLFDLWIKRDSNEVAAAQKALDGVWGCDINPFAVAIARFRLIVAALRACGIKRLKDAPAWKIHLATGDSLLFGQRWRRDGTAKGEQKFLESDAEGSWAPEIYACEDQAAIEEVLGQQYHAVVGNPPYITPKDKALNQAYRERYATCHRQYSLAVPFMERFFDLAVAGAGLGTTKDTKHTKENEVSGAGFVGQITANSFMKREFGKKLIEEFFKSIDLTHVIDTSGAYIPGHGTPTVILFGRNRKPVESAVRAVLGIKGEPSTPADPSQGLVWLSIIQHIDQENAQDAFTSSSDVSRATFASHPWSIGGGGASDLREEIETRCSETLGSLQADIGFLVITGEDNCLVLESDCLRRLGIEYSMPLVLGDGLRDWQVETSLACLWPNDASGGLLPTETLDSHLRFCWNYRTILRNRKAFGVPVEEKGIPWWALRELYSNRLRTPLSIAFAEVATHNHFVLDRGGKVFKQTAPIIKLPADATEDDHLALLGLLNSSAACFWMKQTFHNKGDSTDQSGARTTGEPEFNTFQFNSTGLQRFPIPTELPLAFGQRLDRMAQEYSSSLPEAVIGSEVPNARNLQEAQQKASSTRAKMIALQEELDWACYRLFGLIEEDACYSDGDLPGIELGQRAFEIGLARKIEAGTTETAWFRRQGINPTTTVPAHWPPRYRKLVERRLELIDSISEIGLIEDGMYKRRWNTESWDDQQQRALKNWLLDRLESYWKDEGGRMKDERGGIQPSAFALQPSLHSVAELSDKASGDPDFLQVAAIYRGREDFDVAALVAELVESESVPFLPILRYKPTGLRKREVWERTWELQRREDALKDEGGRMKDENGDLQPSALSLQPFNIPVPPKYTSADFLNSDYWRLRGKLDVPKERWISYPHCETESDPSLVVGWAGWNHLQQAAALIAWYDARKRDGWDAKRLTPLLAGLDQLLPWIHQWHPEIDPEFGETAGQSYETLLKADAHELGLTLEQIRAWEPPAKKKGGRRKAEEGNQPRKTRNTRKKATQAEAKAEDDE